MPSFTFTPVFTDSFNRANENPLNATNWAAPVPADPLQIIGDKCCAVSASAFLGIQTPIATLPSDQYTKYHFAAGDNDPSGFSYVGIYLRNDTVAAGLTPTNGFSVICIPNGGANVLAVDAYVSGVQTKIFSGAITLPAIPFDFAAGAIGNTLYVFVNGVESSSYDISTYSGSITAKNSALLISYDSTPTDTSVTNFEAGSLSQSAGGGSTSISSFLDELSRPLTKLYF